MISNAREMRKDFLSWGRVHRYSHCIQRLNWVQDVPDYSMAKTWLPFGLGRSYGDSCLNEDEGLLSLRALNRLMSFDQEKGILRAEAGTSLREILDVSVPRGWFLPVTPGTQFVTLGGALANDVHGKNHHGAGNFGNHLRAFELRRSDGRSYVCTPDANEDLFSATIGGLGLTGFISWVELQMKRIKGPWIQAEALKFDSLDEFWELDSDSASRFEYTVAWIDSFSAGRGIYYRGNHTSDEGDLKASLSCCGQESSGGHLKHRLFSVPLEAPEFILNPLSMRSFNSVFFHKQFPKRRAYRTHYQSFFYPLDRIEGWNLLYGKRGFFQYQFVLPPDKRPVLKQILQMIRQSKAGAFLSVLKNFGEVPSKGWLSFPTCGMTLAVDFPNRGEATQGLFLSLNDLVSQHGGRLYPAKDAVMSEAMFKEKYPKWKDLREIKEPKFSSSFWRRVGGES